MIFDFKNLSAYGQALKTTSTDVGELSKLISNLTLAQTANALATKNLTTQEMAKILVNKGLTQAEAEATAAKIASAKANGVATFSLKGYIAAIWESIKAIGVWMLTNPIGWVVGLGIAIGGTTLLLDVFTETIDEQKEKIKELKDEYTTLKEELEVLYDQIEKNKDIIDELQSKKDDGIITLVEEDQLRKLKLQNELLEQQYITNEKIKNQKKKELVEKNRTTFKNEFDGSVEKSASINSDISNFYTPGISSYEQAPDKNLILLAKENSKRLENALLSGDEDLVKLLDEDKKLIEAELSERFDTILLGLLEYQNDLSEIRNADGTFDNPIDQQSWNDIESWKKALYKYTNQSGEWNTAKIKVALDNESFKKLEKQLLQRLNDGNLTEQDIEGFTELNEVLKGSNLILEKGKSISFLFLQYLMGIASSQEKVSDTIPKFTFNDSNAGIVDNYQSQLSTLGETLTKLQSGSFSNNDLLDLLQEFPELTDKTGNLSSSIQDLVENKLAILKTELAKQGASTDILNLFDKLADEIKGFSLDNVLSEIKDSRTLLKDVQDELDTTKTITVETLQSIASAYPKLNDLINDYMLGKINEKAIIIALQKEYEKDLNNYKTYILNKKANDTTFYKEIVNSLSDDLINKAKEYGVDLKNYKSYNEAKLAIDKQYRLKKQELESERNEFEDLYENFKPGSSETIFGLKNQKRNFTDDFEEVENYKGFLEEFDTAIKLLIPDFDLDFQSDFDDGESEEQIEEIDWAANSIENLTNKIDGLNTAIENAPGYKKQLELIEQLITEEKKLLGLKERVKDEYSTRYTNSLNALSESEYAKYKPLIESNTAISLEMFKGENRQEVFEKVKAAQEAWQAYQQALADYEEQVGAVADAQDLKYETKADRIQGRIDRHSNNAQDIQNKIDLQTAKNGYADKQTYQDLIDENDKTLKDYDDKLELAKKKRDKALNKHGKNSEEYVNADKNVQEVKDSISSLKQEQIELNREVLRYPVHKLEEEKELLEEQLELVQEKKEKISDSISAASELVQGQIDYYQDLKETTSDIYDAQIKDIQKQKDALTETNDALQQQISLEKARYNLDRAMSQKTVKILRNGEFVYEADVDAIMDAQEALEQEQYNMAVSSFDTKIKNLEDEKQEALDVIDVQIESLTTYKENIDNIVSGYEQVLRLQSLISMFGQDAAQRVLSGDMSIVQEMGNDYIDTASTEKTLQEEIELYADEIEAVEKYALAWAGSKTKIETAKQQIEDILKDTEEELKAIGVRNDATKSVATEWNTTQLGISTELGLIENGQTIAKDNEATILEKRLETLKAFAVEAKGYLNEVATTLASAEQLQAEFNNKNNNKRFLNTGAGVGAALLLDSLKNIKFHDGMESGYVGEKESKDTFKHITLTKLKPDEVPTVLQVGESVLTKLQQTNVLDNMRTAFLAGTKLPNFNNIQKANNTTSVPSITLNGDIVLQGVNNTTEFAKKIKSEFLTKLSQELYK